jgi:hypothetical protein
VDPRGSYVYLAWAFGFRIRGPRGGAADAAKTLVGRLGRLTGGDKHLGYVGVRWGRDRV